MVKARAIGTQELIRLREALEASWGPETSYGGVWQDRNPALGQCYPTSRVVQHFLPSSEIVRGLVWTGAASEQHFWNVLVVDGFDMTIDLTWQQFPPGSIVTVYEVLDRDQLGDSEPTIVRCDLLLDKVLRYLKAMA